MDIERVKNHFKSYSDEQLQWFKEQYEFDVEIEKMHFPFSSGQSSTQTFLKLINEEIEYRKNNL